MWTFSNMYSVLDHHLKNECIEGIQSSYTSCHSSILVLLSYTDRFSKTLNDNTTDVFMRKTIFKPLPPTTNESLPFVPRTNIGVMKLRHCRVGRLINRLSVFNYTDCLQTHQQFLLVFLQIVDSYQDHKKASSEAH